MQVDSLPPEPPGKPKNTGVGSLSILQGNLPDPGIQLGSPALQADSLLPELPGKPLVSVNSLKSFLCLKSFSGFSLSSGGKKIKLVYIGYKTPCALLPLYLFWLISLSSCFQDFPSIYQQFEMPNLYLCVCVFYLYFLSSLSFLKS